MVFQKFYDVHYQQFVYMPTLYVYPVEWCLLYQDTTTVYCYN